MNSKALTISMWSHHSKREKLACITDFARWKLGLLDKYLNVDFNRVDRVIFVCKGNICRSAYAEEKFNMLGAGAISAGTEAQDGEPANADAIRIAAGRGVNLQNHRTQNISKLPFKSGDLFVCMEKMHADVVSANIDKERAQIVLLGGLAGLPRVSDPYSQPDTVFELCFDQIDVLLTKLVSAVDMKNR